MKNQFQLHGFGLEFFSRSKSMTLSNLSANDLRRAASLRERIDALTKELTNILGATAPTTGAVGVQKKRTFSAAVKRKMAASQKARRAKIKAAQKS